MARSSKKPKPTFEVARDPIAEAKSGWVYRSGPEPQVVLASEPREVFEPRHSYQPPQSRDQQSSWIRTGVYLMVLPVTLGMSMMFAPVNWLLGNRSRR